MDRHEQSNIVEDCKNFLKKIEELKLYIIEFKKNGAIKNNIYLSNYVVYDNDYHQIIMIIYNKCLFSANDTIQKA